MPTNHQITNDLLSLLEAARDQIPQSGLLTSLFWLGGNASIYHNQWKWIDNTHFTYNNWALQPTLKTERSKYEDTCNGVIVDGSNGFWSAMECGVYAPFVCQTVSKKPQEPQCPKVSCPAPSTPKPCRCPICPRPIELPCPQCPACPKPKEVTCPAPVPVTCPTVPPCPTPKKVTCPAPVKTTCPQPVNVTCPTPPPCPVQTKATCPPPPKVTCPTLPPTTTLATTTTEKVTTTTTTAPTQKPAKCPAGWTGHNGFCYSVSFKALNWFDAVDYCVAQGGNLASIHSEEEAKFIRSVMFEADVDIYTWIGGFSIRKNDQYVWTDGTSFDFKFWMPQQPANTQHDYCLIIGDLDNFLKWSSFSCQYRSRFVCKKVSL